VLKVHPSLYFLMYGSGLIAGYWPNVQRPCLAHLLCKPDITWDSKRTEIVFHLFYTGSVLSGLWTYVASVLL